MNFTELKKLLPQQYKDSPELSIILEVLNEPFTEIEQVSRDIKDILDIDKAFGAQLDLLGEIVVQKRNGLTDVEYREVLRFKILKNSSKATVDDIVNILKFLTNGTKIVYSDNPPAAYTIYTNGQTVPPNLTKELDKLSGAGIGVSVFGTVDGSRPIIFYDEILNTIEEPLTFMNGDPITFMNGDPITVNVESNQLSQIALTFEEGEVILLETGELVVDETFNVLKGNFAYISSYDLFDGVPLGYLDVEPLLLMNGEPFLFMNGEAATITTDNIISEGTLVLEL